MHDLTFKIGSGMHRTLYRVTRGRVGSRGSGLDFLLLTTFGRKTGKRHTVPLQHFNDSNRTIVIASKGGSENHPHWYLNLESNPQVEVQIRKSKTKMVASTAVAGERKRLWEFVTGRYGGYKDYQRKTTREIPVVILSRTDPTEEGAA